MRESGKLSPHSMLSAEGRKPRAEPNPRRVIVRPVVPNHGDPESGYRNGRLEGVDAINVSRRQALGRERDKIAAGYGLDKERERRGRKADLIRTPGAKIWLLSTLDEVRALLDLADHPQRDCAQVDGIARAHLAEVDRKAADLERLAAELRRIIASCGGGNVADCKIVESLSVMS